MTSPELLKTPLHAWHSENGGKMVPFGGWDMPVQYADGILSEHLATRRCGGLFDVSHMGRFRVEGRDTMAFLQRVLAVRRREFHVASYLGLVHRRSTAN